MKIYVQWSKSPVDPTWELIDSQEWGNLPRNPIQQINVQGMRFSGDHYAVIHEADRIRVFCWNDDPGDWTPEQYESDEIIFYPVRKYNGIVNTKIQRVRYLGKKYDNLKGHEGHGTAGLDIIKHYSEFEKPSDALIRHGVWVTDEDNQICNKEPYEGWESWHNP